MTYSDLTSELAYYERRIRNELEITANYEILSRIYQDNEFQSRCWKRFSVEHERMAGYYARILNDLQNQHRSYFRS